MSSRYETRRFARSEAAIARTLQVARLHRAGFTPGQIAHSLGMTVGIVDAHLDTPNSELRLMAASVGETW